METTAVVFERPERLALRRLPLREVAAGDVLVEVNWSAISTGTERLLWSGRMPVFPGMGYPLVPGYESVGRVVAAEPGAGLSPGNVVFVPGASCFGDVRGLFGGAASRLLVPADRLTRIDADLGKNGVLLALAATAQHALAGGDGRPAELIVGHGALGRLLARQSVAGGGAPVVWEKNPARATGAVGYRVISPEDDARRDYRSIYDVSGDPSLLEPLIGRLARGGEIVLAGFYEQRLSFDFAPAFMREARIRVAAEWRPVDLQSVLELLSTRKLELGGLITHERPFDQASEAYATAFADPGCLKMLIDWSSCP